MSTEIPANRRGRSRRRTEDPEAIRLLAVLDRNTAASQALRSESDKLLEERNAIFLRLVQLGVTHNQIAEHTDVTPPAVKRAIDKMLGKL